MIGSKKVVVVMPAYNAEKTLKQTYDEIPFDIVDEVILTDDCSKDNTVEEAGRLGIKEVLVHERNKGYGGNQKTCYNRALELGADIVIMLHPDYQYTPKLIRIYGLCYSQRCLSGRAGLPHFGERGTQRAVWPWIKYVANRILTFIQNVLLNQKLSEYHTGYRAFSAEVLRAIDYNVDSDDFVFDNEMLAQIFWAGYEIGEVTCPTKYFDEASSINMVRSSIYGLGVLRVSLVYRLCKWHVCKSKLFPKK